MHKCFTYITIATFHVQDFIISNATNNGDINITCIFAIGSNATGCLVIFTSDNYQWNITIYKDGDRASTTTTVPVDTHYKIYDILDDVVSDEPALYGDIYYFTQSAIVLATSTLKVTSKLLNIGMYLFVTLY